MRCRQPAKPRWRKPRWPALLGFLLCHGPVREVGAAPPQPRLEKQAIAAADAPESQRLKEAESHFERGEAHYIKGEYDAAASAFHAAFDLTGEPMLLFNEAQAHRLSSACHSARTRYEEFLRLHPGGDATAALARQHLEQLPHSCGAPSPVPTTPRKFASAAAAMSPGETGGSLATAQTIRAPLTTSRGTGGALWTGAAAAVFAGTATGAWLWNQEQRERLALAQQGLDRVLPVSPGESAAQSHSRHEQMVSERRDQVAVFDVITLSAAVASGIALGVTLYLWLRQDSHPHIEAAASRHEIFLAGQF